MKKNHQIILQVNSGILMNFYFFIISFGFKGIHTDKTKIAGIGW